MLTFEQIASLIILCETLQGDDRHALLSLLAYTAHKEIEGHKKKLRRAYEHRHFSSQGKKQDMIFMRKRVKLLRDFDVMLKRIYQLDV